VKLHGNWHSALWAGASLGALAFCVACSAGDGKANPRPPVGGSGAGGDGNPNGSGGSSATAGSSSIGVGTLLQACGTSSLAKPQLRRLTASELQHSLDDIFPQAKGQWSVGLSEVESPLGFNNDPSLLAVSTQVASKLLGGAQALAALVTSDAILSNVLPCAASAPNHACAQTFLTQYGKRLFRRPLTQADSDRYLGYFDAQLTASDFKSALRWMLTGLVQSPHAIYRREVGANDGGTYHLSQYEIATELAYTFSGTTPSDALLQQADAGTLQTPDQIAAAAGALLATPNGTEVLHQFFKGWLGYDQVPPSLPDVPTFAAVAPDMVQETTHFIDQVIITGRGGPKELLSASFTTPSLNLANFYGFPAPASDYAQLERPAGRGVGVLAQGSLIAAHSHETASSPTLRGLLVFERLLCGVKPTVPPNVPTLVAPSPGVKTTRQRYEEQHMAAGVACPVCHKNFDPIGFGFEHYDEAGRYRQMEGALPIDSSGTLLSQGQPLFSFTGLDDLSTQLATQEIVGRCVSGYVSAYAFANGVPCLGEARRADFVSGKLGILDYFASLAAEPSFTTRH
jgi:Protein of unknown function (DUF1592)/Protein of unknown function (DUF1588)/Protein of unknown function (DUF1595)/Protein of unknown function (DUF1587)